MSANQVNAANRPIIPLAHLEEWIQKQKDLFVEYPPGSNKEKWKRAGEEDMIGYLQEFIDSLCGTY